MNVFKINRFYRATLTVAFTFAMASFCIIFNVQPARKVELFLSGSAIAILLFILLYSISIKVTVSGDTLKKRSLLGSKSLIMSEMIDITMLNMRGRYVFLMITKDRFILLSSLMGDFNTLFNTIKTALPEEPKSKIEKISGDMIDKKNTVMKIFTAVVALFAIGLAFYLYYTLDR